MITKMQVTTTLTKALMLASFCSLPLITNAATPLPQAPPNSQQVFFVGNNWDGTVTVIRSAG